MSENLPENNFEWMKDTSQFKKTFHKKLYWKSDEGYFLEVEVQYLEKLHEILNNLPFLSERMKTE